MYTLNRFKFLGFFLILLSVSSIFAQSNSKFKVVLDAGHGGKDLGANYYGFIEKNIALAVALKVGKQLEKYPDIQVIYTRKTDVFVELIERARIANRANANMFLSIHCNAAPKGQAYGTETFVMGLTKNASNLEVAKKENAVITLESDYKMKYEGYDPKSPESVIGITLLQEEYLDQSITIATKIQNEYTNKLERKNRGVKQGPFLVLNQTAMPSILTELGFLSYKPEGAYLNSEKGQDELAKGIADAILSYKKEYYGGSAQMVEEKPEKTSAEIPVVQDAPKPKDEPKVVENKPVDVKGVVFKVQISASGKKLELLPKNFKGLDPTSFIEENGLYKYFYAQTSSYDDAKQNLAEAKSKGYDSAFIVAFKNGKKISIQEALKQ
ncbi:N-acetylmuramoyl-L-alanine amidase [Flavobacterium azooxidireducens]|uniref:N-acetylmuramoyl-L-alanine amidase n=1 Tax=Flavobacterium azooxidireducens TaxID=1871076 RepID=A0ABY4KEA8_9FLAO|nr:N-acetylmuramoyl-L-alanine amidase [Flavobacterium azooxidireducens]UPQ79126.1 N-acetylmuramoyl-L-alanine amidase [Flavobacterium azooxidireducens]